MLADQCLKFYQPTRYHRTYLLQNVPFIMTLSTAAVTECPGRCMLSVR